MRTRRLYALLFIVCVLLSSRSLRSEPDSRVSAPQEVVPARLVDDPSGLLLDMTIAAGKSSAADLQVSHRLRKLEPWTILSSNGRTILQMDIEKLSDARKASEAFSATLPLDDSNSVDVELRPFFITTNRTQFVLGNANGPDVPYEFDPSRITFLRGRVPGFVGSHVFLAVSAEFGGTGYIDLGLGRSRYEFTSEVGGLQANQAMVFQPTNRGGVSDDTGCDGLEPAKSVPPPARGTPPSPQRGMRFLELALDSDYEFYQLFGGLDNATALVLQLYGELSDIYMRDVDLRVELSFVRLWNSPSPFVVTTDVERFWDARMRHVHRDAVQFLSGKPSAPGYAKRGVLCDPTFRGVSFAGKFTRQTQDTNIPSRFNWNIYPPTHELGHMCNSAHTHDYVPPVDECGFLVQAERGTIMSYCNRVSGGMSNYDMRFHSRTVDVFHSYLETVTCVPYDCNFNSQDDAMDIQLGISIDANANAIPDECEDCDANGTRDDLDIAGGAADVDLDGIPDSCEEDCNGNSVPDDADIAAATSVDANGNRVPDECEADCNVNGIADHVELNADMTLDIDRDGILDECQDCDSDGISNLQELGGAHNVWMANGPGVPSVLMEFNAAAGVLVRASPGPAFQANDLVIRSDGHLLAATTTASVLEFDESGNLLGTLIAGTGGLTNAKSLLLRPNGNLLVANYSGSVHNVLEYDGMTGAFIGEFVANGSGGLTEPQMMTLGPNGNLYVTSGVNIPARVFEFDGTTGAFVRIFVSSGSGGLVQPRGLTFIATGNLVVVSNTGLFFEYDGVTGDNVPAINNLGIGDLSLTFRIGPNGNWYVGTKGTGPICRIQEYENNGLYLRHSFVCGGDNPLPNGRVFAFVPGWDNDCNLNHVPDSCDVTSGTSADLNSNGRPDECETDCNSNGQWDKLDIIPFGTSVDCNQNGIPDECISLEIDCNDSGIPDVCETDCNQNDTHDDCDLAGGTSQDCNFNGVPDECEVDCNFNGLHDSCDISMGASLDCTGDSVPDECEPDCNGNGLADSCDLLNGTSRDCDDDGVPQECQFVDCNNNGVADACDVVDGTSEDCAAGPAHDCCELNHGPGCSNQAIQDCVCEFDLFCCNILWDYICASRVRDFGCGDCGGNGVPDECETDPVISTQPQSITVCEGGNAGFSVIADGTAVLQYQWRKDTVPIPDATSSTYSPGAVNSSSAGLYDVVVTTPCGTFQISDAASLVVVTLSECDDASSCTADGCLSGSCTHTVTPGIPCDDGAFCTRDDECDAGGVCSGVPYVLLFADIVPPGGDGVTDIDDLICLLNGFAELAACNPGDIAPCGGDGAIDIDDLIVLLAAFAGEYSCPHPCPT